MHHDPVHLVPQLLMRDRVLPQDDRPQPFRHERADHVRQRAGDADRPLISFDPDEMLLEAEVVGIDLRTALEVAAPAVFGIDVDRPDQTLLPERAIGEHGPAQAQDADSGDFHGGPPGSTARR